MGFVCFSCWLEGPWRGLGHQTEVCMACHPMLNKNGTNGITVSSSCLEVVSCVLSQKETFWMKYTILLTCLMFGVLVLNLWLKLVNL